MKKFIFIFTVILLYNFFAVDDCYSQWNQMNINYYNLNVHKISSNTNNFFAATFGGVYRSSNNGLDWQGTTGSGYGNDITALTVTGNNIYALRPNNLYPFISDVLLSTNNGLNWTRTDLNQIITFLASSGSNVYASGVNGLWLTTNRGINWVNLGLNGHVSCLAVSGDVIYAGTGSSRGVWISTNNGQNWTQSSLNDRDVISLAVNGNNVFAGCNSANGGLFKSTNGGVSWSQTALNYLSVSSLAITGNYIFAGTEQWGVYLSTNNGLNWIEKNDGFSTFFSIPDIYIANNYVFAGTSSNSIWRRSLSEIFGIVVISTELPIAYSISQNYPNPFNPFTKIRFDVPRSENVIIKVYDMLGKEITTLVNQQLHPGTYETDWNASAYSSGIYYYKIIAGNYTETKKMVLIK